MNVIRVQKNKDYSVISNIFLRDKELSYAAKGLLANIMTHAEGYQFSINGVVATSKEKKTAIYTIIRELLELGYAKREQKRLDGSLLGDVIYTFYEAKFPQLVDTLPHSGFLEAEVLEAEVPHAEYQPQRSTNIKEETKIRNTNTPEASPPDIPDFERDGFINVKTEPTHTVSSLRKWKEVKFFEFWDKYKKKKSQAKCLAKWLLLDKKEIEEALAVVDDHVIITPDIQYRKHPITWLTQRCWEDDITEELKRYKPRSYPKTTIKDNDWY